jgi:hypothetical protein
VSLRDILSEFESSLGITADDQFVKERSQIISNVELDLEKKRTEEASAGEIVKSLSENRILLERIGEDYAATARNVEKQKDTEIKRLSVHVDGITEELNRIGRMKTGIFGAISKRAKEQKEAETKERLNAAQSELASVAQHFTDEQEELRGKYERSKQSVVEKIRDHQKEIERQDIDDFLEARGAACEALIRAVNSFLERKGLSNV